MASDLTSGSVPSLYLDVINILGSADEEPSIDRNTYFNLFSECSGLTKTVLAQIWDIAAAESQGNIKRTGIFKFLALIAFAQQGKTLSDNLLLNFSGDELPLPNLGDIQNLKSLLLRSKMRKTGNVFNLDDVLALDTIQVELVPEKKGLFLKHVEYEVTSQRYKTTVKRRYSDFVAFHDILVLRFPFRIVPLLPPKKLGGNAEFIEERRKALQRFLNLIARHPVMMEDRTVEFFMTFIGSDMQHKIKDYTRNIPEETDANGNESPFAFAPDGGQAELSVAREQMKQVYGTIVNLRNCSQHLMELVVSGRDEILLMGKEFSVLSQYLATSSIHAETSKVLAQMYPHFSAISQATDQQAKLEDEELVERQDILIDLLSAYRELGERYDAAFSQEPPNQSRTSRIPSMSLRRGGGTSPLSYTARQEEELSHPVQLSWESRKALALQSFLNETHLVQAYLNMIWVLVQSMVTIRSTWLKKMAALWDNMQPMVYKRMVNNSLDSPTR